MKKMVSILYEKSIAACTILLFFIAGCKESPNPILTDVGANVQDVITLQKAEALALKGAFQNLSQQQSANARQSGDVQIESSQTYNDTTGSALFHVIKFKDRKGFRIISADKKFVPLLAYSDNDVLDEKLPGISQWFAFLTGNLPKEKKNMEKNPDESKQKSLGKLWNTFESTGFPFIKEEFSTKNKRIPVPGQNDCPPGRWTVQRLVTTSWGQSSGFNYYFPPTSCSSLCDKQPSGCGATAMSQIIRANAMNGHGGPSGYNYGSMPNLSAGCGPFPSGDLEAGRLVKNVAASVGSFGFTVSIPFYCSTSTATFPWGIPSGFSQMGYSNGGNYGDFFSSYSNIVSDVVAGYPVIMSGKQGWGGNLSSWHIWVIDGIDHYVTSDCYVYDWFQCNWGWNGSGNSAWYWYGSGSYNGYDTELRAVTNIRP